MHHDRWHRMRCGFACVVLVVACDEPRVVPRAPASPPAASSSRPAPPAASSTVLAPPPEAKPPPPKSELPPVDFGPRGPLVVVGYPRPIGLGTDVAIASYGFTANSFAYCFDNHGSNDGSVFSECDVVDAAGASTRAMTGDPVKRHAWERDHALIATPFPPGYLPVNTLPPKVTGDWAFARDLRLHVEATEKKYCDAPASFRVGGAFGTEPPVWIATVKPATTNPCNSKAWIDVVALSPDGAELGVAFRANGARWDSDDMAGFYSTTARLAANVYNATGFRHHAKREWPRAAELFLLAAQADPTWELPAYNLACAWSQAGDARAELALREAIARGGPAVRERARKDDDFAKARAAMWFVTLTQ